jgi:hypothetical protein
MEASMAFKGERCPPANRTNMRIEQDADLSNTSGCEREERRETRDERRTTRPMADSIDVLYGYEAAQRW